MINDLIYKYFTIKNTIIFLVLGLLTWFAFKNPDIFLMFFVSAVIACSLNPLVDRLNKRFSRDISAAIVLGSFLSLLCLFLLPIIVICIYQITSLTESFPQYIKNLDNIFNNYPILQTFGIDKNIFGTYFTNIAVHTGEYIDGAYAFFKNIGSTFIYVIISIILTYFFMADTNTVKTTFLKLFPSNIRSRTEEIIDIIANKIGGYITAQIYAIASVGIVMTIVLLIFRVDYAILLGLITAILDIIPIAGPALALIICLIATYEAGLLPIIGVIVAFTAAQLIENNLVRPYAYSKLLNLHPILIFTSLIIAAKYLGVIGVLFAPAMAACVCVVVEELYIKNIE